MSPTVRPGLLVVLLAAAFVVGCGRPTAPTTSRVSGRITLDGRPVPAGTITFKPDAEAGGSGHEGYAIIDQGTFDTEAGGQGIPGGAMIVIIEVPGVRTYQTKANLVGSDIQQDFDVPRT